MSKTILWIVGPITLVLLVALVLLFQTPRPSSTDPALSYTKYAALQNRVKAATIHGDEVSVRDDMGRQFTAHVPSGSAEAARLAERGIDVTIVPATPDSPVPGYIVVAFNAAWLLAALWYLRRIAQALEKPRDRPGPELAGAATASG